jgi:hypothetical protein
MVRVSIKSTIDTRYTFTGQFVHGAAIFSRRAHLLETSSRISDEEMAEHRACVAGAIMHSAAALESEVTEILLHGPSHHLANSGPNSHALTLLKPIKDRHSPLCKYELVLRLLGKPALARDLQPYQSTDLLFRLRNELVHYKSKWGRQMKDADSVFAHLEALQFSRPPFTSIDMEFFPHRCLSASLASWSVTTSINFINNVFKHLGIRSPIADYSGDLSVPPLKRSS